MRSPKVAASVSAPATVPHDEFAEAVPGIVRHQAPAFLKDWAEKVTPRSRGEGDSTGVHSEIRGYCFAILLPPVPHRGLD